MARRRAQSTDGTFEAADKPTPDVSEDFVQTKAKPAPAASDLKVTPEEGKIENLATNAKEKKVSATEAEVEAPEKGTKPEPAAALTEKVQTDVRERLAKKSPEDNIFVPSTPAALEKAAAEVAQEQGFELNRGTSIGARLMARAQKRDQ
jgi:hypothetical protein